MVSFLVSRDLTVSLRQPKNYIIVTIDNACITLGYQDRQFFN
jgi:hypothetical protein